jgi:hypothetical protein
MGFLEDLGSGLKDVLDAFVGSLGSSLKESISTDVILDNLDRVDVGMTQIIGGMGAGRELSHLIKSNIAGAYTNVKLLGGDLENIVQQQQNLNDSTGRQLILQREYHDDLFATTKVTEQSAHELITAFDNAGKSVYDIKNTMEGVVNQSRSLGLNATEVSSRMVTNLEKMNMYGFERGVEGLSRMAAKSAMFKLDMSSTFNLADKLISPEQAVEFSARLQSLGIQSELIDPFRAMDLATNDMEELQNQMIELGKGMTYYNEQTGKVEIFKEKRGVIKELAAAAGMTSTEFSRMIVQSETLNRKMAEIKMPNLNITEDQKTMIANLAAMKDGPQGKGYYVQIEKDDGTTTEKLVSSLDEKDILKLADQVANPKTMEELAQDQVDFLSRMANSLDAIKNGPSMGIAGSKLGEGVVDLTIAADALVYKPLAKAMDSGKIADIIDKSGDDLKKIYESITTSASGFDGTLAGFKSLLNTGLDGITDATLDAALEFQNNLKQVKRLGTFANYGEVLDRANVNEYKVGEVNDGFVYGQGNNKQIVQTHPDDNAFFAQRQGMVAAMGGMDILQKVKETIISANAPTNNNNNYFEQFQNMAMNQNNTKEVNHKMDPIKHEGELKFSIDINAPAGVDTRALNEIFKNNTGFMQNLIVQFNKQMNNNYFTKAPTDVNRTYINAG